MARVRSALHYFFFSSHKRGYGIHSPFVYQLIRRVFLDKTDYGAYTYLRQARTDYLHSREIITVRDYGAGHGNRPLSRQRTVRDIIRHSATRPRYSRLLFRLVHYFKPQTILETGTSLGTGTLSLALGNSQAQVFTIEGDPASATLAEKLFRHYGLENISIFKGLFSVKLPEILPAVEKTDFIFMDGHHDEEATIHYFDMILPYIHDKSILVLDDIHWSSGMERAWAIIRNHPRVTLTIDIFQMGLVFFDPGLSRQIFIIRF